MENLKLLFTEHNVVFYVMEIKTFSWDAVNSQSTLLIYTKAFFSLAIQT